ncbi:cytochrome c oxidase subunit 4 [Allostreptomyces psammosilenae]|uniref:Cytochrome c oxidase polypeptide 4 n=1 Tax=Allostreptomyces psammosilenae TaxID=1892865 RepID=A0A852ZXA2_9ACTN|nr:cytochrome c oxidase subunit 4 [Allostreptomyces psammosilenae]NYI07023.1 hypothetical protein [Allostreptomyces psammosilenae]
MRFQGKLFLWLAVFLAVMVGIYAFWAYQAEGEVEPVGTVALTLAFCLCLMVGFYLWFTARRVDVMAGDRKDAEVSDDAGEQGFFSPHSWQPLFLALGGAFSFLGIAVDWWVLVLAAPFAFLGLFGWVFEYYRGEDQRY